MNILYFHQHFSTPQGSTGTRSYEMAKRLIYYGHSVTMVCGSYGGGKTGLSNSFIKGRREGFVDGIRVIEFNLDYSNNDGFFKRTLTFIRFASRSISLAFKEKYDVLVASSTPLTAGIPGIFANFFLRKPFVFEVRDLWPELPREMGVIKNPVILGLMGLLEWLSYHSASRCIGLSPGIVQGIEKLGINNKNIAMIPNGCDLEMFDNSVKPWRPENVKNDDFMAVYTGTHGIANGLDILVDVAYILKQRGREDIKIVLVGDGKLKSSLKSKAENLNLDNIIFHPPVSKIKLTGLMKSADLGMQLLDNVPAFYYGTSPNKFFDYIAAGLPVLNNYTGWLADMIKKNECGFVVPPEEPQAFADSLQKAASDKNVLKSMGKKSYILAKNQFDRHNLADDWVKWVTGAAK